MNLVQDIRNAFFSLLLIGFGQCAGATEQKVAAEWHMNEGTGKTIVDSSGNGNNGTANPEWVTGDFGNAALFDGNADNSVKIPPGAQLNLGVSDFSLEFWIFPQKSVSETSNQRVRLFSKASQTAYWVVDMLTNNGVQFEVQDDKQQHGGFNTAGALRIKQWNHVAVIVDRRQHQVKFYLNGNIDRVMEMDANLKGSFDAKDAPLYIGGNFWAFEGMIGEVKLSRHALTESEVKQDYERQKALRSSDEYRSKAQLTAVFTTKANYAVFAPREPVTALVSLSGFRSQPDVLNWRVRDFNGKTCAQGTVTVPAGTKEWQTELKMGQYGAGYFELHLALAKLGIGPARHGSRGPGMICYAVLPDIEPLALAHPDDSRFGMQGKSFVDSGKPGQGDPFAPVYQLVGARWVYEQKEQPWLMLPAWLEKTGPNIYKPNLDAKDLFAQKKYEMKSNLSVIFDLHSVPPWLMNTPDGKIVPPDKVVPAHNCQDYPPKDWNYYGELLGRLASEKALMRKTCFPTMRRSYYQIHWEIDWYWKGSDDDFIRMYETAAKSIKKVDPGAFIVGPNYGVIATGNNHLEKLFAKGLGKYIDGIAIHSYFLAPGGENGSAPEEGGVVREARRLMSMVRKYLPPGAPVYNTEGSSRVSGDDPATDPAIMRRQSGWFLRHHLIGLGEGFAATWFFYLVDNDRYSSYGLFYNLMIPHNTYQTSQIQPKPLFAVTAVATRLLEGTKSLGAVEYLGDNVLGYNFDRNGQILMTLWSTDDREREVTVPTGSEKVWFYDAVGNRKELTAANGDVKIIIGANPVYLLGLSPKAVADSAATETRFPGDALPLKSDAWIQRGNDRFPLKRDAIIPLKTQPGIWLLQAQDGGRLIAINAPASIKASCGEKIMESRFTLTVKNLTSQQLSGNLYLCAPGMRRDLGPCNLSAAAERQVAVDIAAMRLDFPAPQKLTVEFVDQHGVISKSAGIDCSITFVPKTKAAPAISASENGWEKVTFHRISGDKALAIKNPEAPLTGDDDLSFCFAFLYDDKALYLAIKVRDQNHTQNQTDGNDWREDSVQLGIATDWNGSKWNTWQKLCLALNKNGVGIVRRNSGSHQNAAEISAQEVPCFITRNNGETVYKIALPWRFINPAVPVLPPQKKLGIGILVNDVDMASAVNSDKVGSSTLQAATEAAIAEISANPKRKSMEAYGGMFWGKPEEFGVLSLLDK